MAGFGHPRRVVVAVPDIGHDDGRLAEEQAFRERVVAAMVDHRSRLREHRRLRKPRLHDHIAGHIRVLVLVAAHIHQRAIARRPHRRDDALEEFRVARAQRAERHVKQRPIVVLGEARHRVGLLLPHAAFQVLELLGIERVLALEFHRLGVEQEVEKGRGLEELPDRVGLLAVLLEKRVEVGVKRPDHFVEAAAIALVAGVVVFAAARQVGRDGLVLDLVFRARDDAHPGLARLLDGGKQDHVIDADQVGLDAGQHARQVFLRPARAVHDRGPAVFDVSVDLLVRTFAEVGDVAVDEVLPELRHLLGRHGLGQVHRMRLEAVALIHLHEAWIGQEHRLVPAPLHGLGDAD